MVYADQCMNYPCKWAYRWLSLELFDDKSTDGMKLLNEQMFMSPYGVTRQNDFTSK